MKTFEEIAETWSNIVSIYGYIPRNEQLDDDGEINGLIPDIQDPACCIVGEAMKGGCYFDRYLDSKTGEIADYRTPHENQVENPKYCSTCRNMSIEFYDCSGNAYNSELYEELVARYKAHFNEKHLDNTCEDMKN